MSIEHWRGGKLFDVAIVGGGVLGVTAAYWLSQLYDCSITIIDLAPDVAAHTSSRNTGVIHRPFYLNPETKRVFAVSAERSYPMWRSLARRFGLPWSEVGTLEVALREEDVATLEKYRSWGERNGMMEGEAEVLDGASVTALEREVRCKGAIYSKADVCVDFGLFTKAVFGMAEAAGVRFLGGITVTSIETHGDGSHTLSFRQGRSAGTVDCRFLINAAGGGSVDIAHMMGVGKEFTDLHFRGEYWLVDEPFASRIKRNIYSVARHSQFPFLDPHFVVRADGTRQIGPNATLVSGPFVYKGLGWGLVGKILERPLVPKLNLFTSGTFLSLIWTEWRSSVSKGAMCGRVAQFIPSLNPRLLNARGLAGVRSSLIDSRGFVPEALQLETQSSFHVLNFNSPGASGAPVFSALAVNKMRESGALDALSKKPTPTSAFWNFDAVLRELGSEGRLP
jgi:L-2-hydroxyglutarate oxidase